MTLYGYTRISTEGQTLDAQIEALTAAVCDAAHIFRENVAGAHADRPQLNRLLAKVGKGDVVVVSRFDRLARTTRDLLNILDKLVRRFRVSKSTISRLAKNAAGLPDAPVKPRLDAQTERAVRDFMQRIAGTFPAVGGVVFGSRARGTYNANSDADLAVILKGERGNRYEASREMAGVAFDVMLETEVLIDPLPLWEDEFNRPEIFSNPALIENIKREGVRL